jgi:hypothetical protein
MCQNLEAGKALQPHFTDKKTEAPSEDGSRVIYI